ncbi:5-oxoprolinase subunit PxpB [Pseudoalteromonas piscicida]|uniref:5-oxoprolinase subunit PxpB n=1 Tax=Pseudoalteromonas piscicida TaxID=43662 RepID=UPI0030C99899
MSDVSCYLLGEQAIVVDAMCLPDSKPPINQRLFALKKWLDNSGDFIDVVPAKSSVTAYLKESSKATTWQHKILTHWQDLEIAEVKPTHHEIEVFYGKEFGQDFERVASELQLTPRQLIELHSSVDYQVQFIGFLPGFAYLSGLPTSLQLPRKSTPITKVPKGSIAIADSYSAIYPSQSPGGWHLLGQTNTTLFDPNSASASLLQPGDIVRFVEKSC